MWWLVIDHNDTDLFDGEEVSLDLFIRYGTMSIGLDNRDPVGEGDELWVFERTFRRASGLARAASSPYRSGRRWWLDVTMDLKATKQLRRSPVRPSERVFRYEPYRYGAKDPWMVRMHLSDLSMMRNHLQRLARVPDIGPGSRHPSGPSPSAPLGPPP
ncbi:hypothetical protein [Micromonospora aurantiaca (nom. illeg.)]|uniref:hypothetical protein n=1 Tax=Micromonospora aurantiaca (nom. illeg.) TaxID=47850 RepID=UPI003664AB04